MNKKISFIMVRVVVPTILITLSGYGFAVMWGLIDFHPVYFPLLIVGIFAYSFFALRPERKKYRLYLSKHPDAQARDQRERRLMRVGYGLVLLSVFLSVVTGLLLPNNATIWLAIVALIGMLFSLFVGLALSFFYGASRWVRYFKDVYRW